MFANCRYSNVRKWLEESGYGLTFKYKLQLSLAKMSRRQPLLAAIAWTTYVTLLVHCNEEMPKEDITPLIYTPTWMYKCVPDEGCVRVDMPHGISNASVSTHSFESLDVCRTVCGRFGGLWPKPYIASMSMQTVQIHPNYLRFDLLNVPAETRGLLVEMTQLVGSYLAAECGGNVSRIAETPVLFHINVSSSAVTLDLDTDESYKLDVQNRGSEIAIKISANTVYGARHALETFTQLVAADRPSHADRSDCGLRLVSAATIKDRPVYKYRGLLLDTSRHFIPMKDIKRTIRGMAAVKMNVFHWHVTDSHSFPLESRRVPQLTRYGAYSSEEMYSTEEVRELIRYAQVRGVRVVIEIDAPAHTGNGWQWGKEHGLGDLAVCVNAVPWRPNCIQPPCGQLNPANPNMYTVLKDLYKDIADLIPQPALFHMGGDEVFAQCWNSSSEILAYMKQNGWDNTEFEGFISLWGEFHSKALQSWDEVMTSTGSPPQPVMLWSSELTQAKRIQDHLSRDRYIIEVWEPLGSPLLSQLTRLGYRVVSVPKDIWYLDHGFWGITKYSNWRRMYGHILPNDNKVLGGEVAMWSEYVDEQGMDPRIWPRAAAVAERLWADPIISASAAEPRLQRMRGRLIARGLRPDAMSPEWCGQHDSRCL